MTGAHYLLIVVLAASAAITLAGDYVRPERRKAVRSLGILLFILSPIILTF